MRRIDVWLGRFDALLVLTAWCLLFFVAPHEITSDGSYRHTALVKLMDHAQIANDKWPMIGTFLSAPFYWIGRHVETPDWWVSRYNCILLGAGVFALDRILSRHVPVRVVRAFGLLLLTSSMLPHETTDFGAEMFNAIGVAVGLAAWGTGRFVWGSILMALGVANMPASIVGLGFALTRHFFSHRRLRVVIPVVLAIALCLGENWIRKGGPLHFGYDHEAGYKTSLPYSGEPGFSYPFALGVLSLLFSAGKGILFFAPGLFLPWRDARRRLGATARGVFEMWALFVVGLFAVYSRWWAWYGGYAWGPRFLVFASIPAAFVLAVRLRGASPRATFSGDMIVLIVLALSIWAGVDGVTFRMLGQPRCMSQSFAFESNCWYIPEFTVLVTPFVQHAKVTAQMRWPLGFGAMVFAYFAVPLIFGSIARMSGFVSRALTALDPRRWRF